MLSSHSFCAESKRFSCVLLAIVALLCFTSALLAQTTVGTGSVVGTVTDPSGAVLSGAKITIKNAAMGQTIDLLSNSSGAFNSGSLQPGNYTVQVASKGF